MRPPLLLFAALLTSQASASEPDYGLFDQQEGWKTLTKKSTDVGEVKVVHRVLDKVNCLQGTTVAEIAPQALLDVLLDVPSATKWSSAGLSHSDLLASSDGKIELYQYIDIPGWTLVADRYWVLSADYGTTDAGLTRYRWNRLDGATHHPEAVKKAKGLASNAIEPPVNWGQWTFLPTDTGTRVTYAGCADAGGALSTTVQRWASTRTLPDTVADLVREAKRRNGS